MNARVDASLPPLGPTRLGVLGGGQLGRMMIQEAMNWDVRVEVMDPSRSFLQTPDTPLCAGRPDGCRSRENLWPRA